MTNRVASTVLSLGIGVVAGILVTVVTQVATRSTVGGIVDGEAWSLNGNGALVVPLVGIPAVLGAGWAALALRAIGHPWWRPAGVGAAALLGVLGLAAAFGYLLVGRDQAPMAGATVGLLSGVAALGFARLVRPFDRMTIAVGVAVAALSVIVQGEATGLLFPLPTLVAVRTLGRRTSLLIDGLALVVGLMVGIVAAIPLVFAIAGWWYEAHTSEPAG